MSVIGLDKKGAGPEMWWDLNGHTWWPWAPDFPDSQKQQLVSFPFLEDSSLSCLANTAKLTIRDVSFTKGCWSKDHLPSSLLPCQWSQIKPGLGDPTPLKGSTVCSRKCSDPHLPGGGGGKSFRSSEAVWHLFLPLTHLPCNFYQKKGKGHKEWWIIMQALNPSNNPGSNKKLRFD